ncbi:hypothetical protein BJ944DRAFT_267017 [Cunninghamella echinulata]|nr:hypothetical protein BJ944DRAFT_267017 [Cunninghamella echinulata]
MPSYQLLPQVKASLEYILDHYNKQEKEIPIVVGISGIPNIGKSTLCHTLSHILEQDEYQITNTILSLDDHTLSLQDQVQTIQSWIQQKTYSIIFIEGTFLGYKPLLPNHRLWSLLKKNTIEKRKYQQWELFNQSLHTLQHTLYPLIQLFIQLSPTKLNEWQLSNQQLIMHRYYLERLNHFGFFDTQQENNNSQSRRHLTLIVDKDRKLIRKHLLLDGTYQQYLDHQYQQQQQEKEKQIVVNSSNNSGNLSTNNSKNLYLRLLRSNGNHQLLASLHPKVLISFAMMSLLGLLGYSRRLSIIFDFINKFQQLFF